MIANLDVKKCLLSSLKFDDKNARKHDKKNLKSIKDSLDKFGQVEPLVVQKSTMKVIGGNGRLEAMKDLGWKDCDIALIDIDNDKAKALGLALNRSAELAEWNDDNLKELLSELDAEGWDLESLGWDSEDLSEMSLKVDDIDLPDLKSGDKEPFQQMAFVLSDAQAEIVKNAIKKSIDMGDFNSENQNKNGNGIARICELFLENQ